MQDVPYHNEFVRFVIEHFPFFSLAFNKSLLGISLYAIYATYELVAQGSLLSH
ncbi:hypothetical protein GCM10009410_01320 [Shewanella ulleungensis]|uniref:Uncharacterized protein n=1 Tax=Shewanella ulleungensis TaxID=2282699 RepID=A0ABQ2QDY4_9GAMM|nr:hypothetical protein GCM10009410_01320 [Shewanella ulleungensis]